MNKWLLSCGLAVLVLTSAMALRGAVGTHGFATGFGPNPPPQPGGGGGVTFGPNPPPQPGGGGGVTFGPNPPPQPGGGGN